MSRVLVIGGGIAGLSAAYWIAERSRHAGRPLSVQLIEASRYPGGHVRTVREDGFLVEAGPNGWLDREPAARRLLDDLGLAEHRLEASAAARRRYVVRNRRLCRVPDSPPGLLSSPALSPLGKLRLLLEPFAVAAPADMDETVFDFARRRVGAEAAEHLVDAAISGITAGDSRRLSVASAFPMMVDMEREHGSLIRAMIARRAAGPTRLVTLDRGLEQLVEKLARSLGDRLMTGVAARRLWRRGGEFRVAVEGGVEIAADHVVLALPSWHAARLVTALDPGLAVDLETVPAASLAVVALAYRSEDVGRPLDGYGYLLTRGEGRNTLGVVWESSLFPRRSPEGTVLLRAMLGGVRHPGLAAWTPEALETVAREEATPLLGLRGEPLRSWVFRWPTAIPQYEVGHGDRIRRIRAGAARHPGLHLCGTSYDGVSFASAIASADQVADLLAAADGVGTHREERIPLEVHALQREMA